MYERPAFLTLNGASIVKFSSKIESGTEIFDSSSAGKQPNNVAAKTIICTRTSHHVSPEASS